MKQTVTMKTVMAFFLGAWVFNAMAEPTVSDVVVRQRWPWSRLVDIYYKLDAAPGETFDLTVTAKNGAQTLTIPSDALSGDLLDVVSGERHIVFDPMKTGDADGNAWAQFNVTVTPTEAPPLYAIVDLNAPNQITYLSVPSLASGAYGAVETNAVDGSRNIYWTGVTNDSTYKTDKIVLRRVRSGTFNFGNAGTRITLTKNFYIGVFEITQAQWTKIMGAEISVSTFTNAVNREYRPMECVSYYDIREIPGAMTTGSVNYANTSAAISPRWPETNAVGSTSFMGKLRTGTGINTFDLPTSAQWEYACRANPDVTTPYNDNDPDAVTTTPSVNMNRLGRYSGNGGTGGEADIQPCNNATTAIGTAIVGSYTPNNWGLYDMHGNVSEWMLDRYGNAFSLNGTVDPKGPTTGGYNIYSRNYRSDAAGLVSSVRDNGFSNMRNRTVGFRLVMNAP